jgi:hypothetical protein
MKQPAALITVLFSAMMLNACVIDRLNTLSDMNKMSSAVSKANKAGEAIDTYQDTKKVINTADQVYKIANTPRQLEAPPAETTTKLEGQ